LHLHLSEVCHQNPPRRAVAHGAFLCLRGKTTPKKYEIQVLLFRCRTLFSVSGNF
jgi:hypothetical protein